MPPSESSFFLFTQYKGDGVPVITSDGDEYFLQEQMDLLAVEPFVKSSVCTDDLMDVLETECLQIPKVGILKFFEDHPAAHIVLRSPDNPGDKLNRLDVGNDEFLVDQITSWIEQIQNINGDQVSLIRIPLKDKYLKTNHKVYIVLSLKLDNEVFYSDEEE